MKSHVPTQRASSKRKGAQPFGGAATSQVPKEPEPKKTKPTMPKVIKVAGTPQTSPNKNQKKKLH